jgi:hypothetical protein
MAQKMALCFVLAVSGLTAASAARLNGDISNLGREEGQQHTFTVSDSHVKKVCSNKVVRDACTTLGSYGGKATPAQLADTLAAEEGDAMALLRTLGLEADVTRSGGYFGCQAFCLAAVAKIPSILREAVPASEGQGCLDDACTKSVEVTEDALTSEGLKSPHDQQLEAENVTIDLQEEPAVEEEDPALKAQRIFRLAVNTILGVFPAPDEQDDDEGSGASDSLMEGPGGVDVAFGSRTKASRHAEYRELVVKAAAWLSYALKRLRAGRPLVKKWFVLRSEAQVDAQMIEARKHMTRMWQLMNHILIKKGLPSEEGGPCSVQNGAGTMAYVMKSNRCHVPQGFRTDCGEKERGRYIVNICEFYWSWGFGTDTHVGTIVHESSHHFGTTDHGYCDMVDCLALSSTKARDNADTYTKLIGDLVASRHLHEDPLGGEHPLCNTDCGAVAWEDWDFSASLPAGTCGRCEAKTKSFLGLWGEACAGNEIQAAEGTVSNLCCRPYQCATTTTTTEKSSGGFFGNWRW